MTPQEINEKVAQKLGFGEWVDQQVSKGGNLDWSPKDYCGRIEAAWEIVTATRGTRQFHLQQYPQRCIAMFGHSTHGSVVFAAEADTAPMAICKAFLKLGWKP